MPDTARNRDAFLNAATGLFRDNTSGDISPQDLRDFVLSAYGSSFLRAVSGAVTADPGDVILATVASAYSVTLPASPVAGDVIAVKVVSQTGTANLTIARNLKNIEGAAADLTLTVKGELFVVAYDGTEWWIVGQHLIPHEGSMTLSANITTNTAATAKKITYDQEVNDVGGIVDTGNNRMTARRAGTWIVGHKCGPAAGVADQKYYIVYLYKNGSIFSKVGVRQSTGATSTILWFPVVEEIVMAANDYVEGWFQAEQANMGVNSEVEASRLWVVEKL